MIWKRIAWAALAVALAALGIVIFKGSKRDRATGTGASEVATDSQADVSKSRRSRPVRPPHFDEAETRRMPTGEPETPPEDLKCVHKISPDCPAYPPSRAVLLARARCGTVLTDTPAFLMEEDADDRSLPITPDQRAAHKLAREFRAEVFQAMDDIHRELAGAAYKPSRTMTRLLTRTAALAKPGWLEIQRTIAEELAGLRPAPTPEQLLSRPPAERFWRLRFGIGDRYEKRAAEVFGADPVRAKRQEGGGWAEQTLYMGKCPD